MIRPGFGDRLAHDVTNRGVSAWLISAALFAFYLVLYFTEWLTPVALALHLGSKWTLYGTLYTLAILLGGGFMLRRYAHNRYQVIRTISVMGVQLLFAYSLPQFLVFLKQPEFYFSYLWPLKLDYLNPNYIFHLPLPFILWSILGSFLLVPILGIFFGKRWYCSWVCGCGGLANTFGEPWRHLSSKSTRAWRFERASIYTVLGIAVVLTALMFVSYAAGGAHPQVASFTVKYQTWYGLIVASLLSGVFGVGLYPINGTRVWCRFFCPMAALLGIVQKAGRYRITVKDDMCISCGLCSKYCEMGIDVRSYAQSNESFTRASCVGCGLCAEVCPRGVLRLENVSRQAQQLQLVQIQRL
jgi:polyferredoxin